MDKQFYRVVLTGELASGSNRESAIAALARLFETSAANLINVFEGGERPIEDLLDGHEAAALQKRLERIGARARVDRVPPELQGEGRSAGGLRLPASEDPADAGLMHCPACGHAQLVAKSCDECGVVFAEFNRQRGAGGYRGPVPTELPHSGSGRSSPAMSRPAAPPRRRPAGSRQDIHADANADWREDWLDDGNEVPTEEYHVNLFMGMHSAHLADPCRRMMLGRRTRLMLSWAGAAVFSPFLWVMYRKMWAWGMVIFVTEILAPVALITLGAKADVSDTFILLGIGVMVANRVFWPAVLKTLYCRHARKTIMQMHRMSPTYAPDIDIATRGGTSRTSVFVGVVLAIVASLLAWSIVDTLHARMPAAAPVFSAPATVPETEVPSAAATEDSVVEAQNELLANENRWVLTRNRLRTLGQRINAWFADGGRGTDPVQLDITALGQALALDPDSMLDGWGRPVAYESDGKGYKLVSAGPDGEFGGSDDVEYRRILER